MQKLISYLTAIKFYSKSVHYNLKGIEFYGNHLLADRVEENMDDYIDRINEVCFLGSLEETPSPKIILEQTLELIPDQQQDNNNYIKTLFDLLQSVHDYINGLKNIYNLTEAETNLIGEIDENIQQSIGLINRILI